MWLFLTLGASLFLYRLVTQNTSRAYFILCVLIFAFDYWVKDVGLLPRPLIWIKEFLLVFILLDCFIQSIKRSDIRKNHILKIVIGFLVLVGLQTVSFRQSGIHFVHLFREYVKYVPLFLLIINYGMPDDILNQLDTFLKGFVILNTILAMSERFLWGWSNDECAGFLASGHFAVFGLCLLCYFLMQIIMEKSWLPLGYVVLILLTSLIAEIKAVFLVFPMILFLSYSRILFQKYRFVLGLIFCMIVASFSSAKFFDRESQLADFIVQQQTLHDYMWVNRDPERGIDNAGRMTQISVTWDYMEQSPWYIKLIGHGVGIISQSRIDQGERAWPFLWDREQRKDLARLHELQINKILIECGVVGLFLVGLLFYRLYQTNRHFLRMPLAENWKAFALSFQGMLLVMIIMLFYNQVFMIDAAMSLFWMFAGLISRKLYELKVM